jgi:hypothetical protein
MMARHVEAKEIYPKVPRLKFDTDLRADEHEHYVCNMDCRICQERFKQNHRLPFTDRYKTTYDRSYTKPKDVQAAFRRFEEEMGALSNRYGPDAWRGERALQDLEIDRAEFPFGRKRMFQTMRPGETDRNRYHEYDNPEEERLFHEYHKQLEHAAYADHQHDQPPDMYNEPYVPTIATKQLEHTTKGTQYSEQGSANKLAQHGSVRALTPRDRGQMREPSPLKLHEDSPVMPKRGEDFLKELDRQFYGGPQMDRTDGIRRLNRTEILPIAENLGIRFADWMSSPNIQSLRVNELVIPTAHNAHSYKIHDAFPLNLNHIISQACDVYDLLLGGVRCLELRLHNDQWCSVQRFKTVRITELANLIGKFATDYTTEVVFLDIQNEANQLGSDHISIQKLFNDTSGNRVAKNLTDSTSVGELVRTRRNIVLIWSYKIDQLSVVDSHYETSGSNPELVVQKCQRWALKQPLKTNHSGYLKMLSCFVSPTKDAYVIGGNVRVLDADLRHHAESCNFLVNSYLLSDEILDRVHFVKIDFVHPEIICRIVDYNARANSRKRAGELM